MSRAACYQPRALTPPSGPCSSPPKLPTEPGFKVSSNPGQEPQKRQSYHRSSQLPPNQSNAPSGVSFREGTGDATP